MDVVFFFTHSVLYFILKLAGHLFLFTAGPGLYYCSIFYSAGLFLLFIQCLFFICALEPGTLEQLGAAPWFSQRNAAIWRFLTAYCVVSLQKREKAEEEEEGGEEKGPRRPYGALKGLIRPLKASSIILIKTLF